jgi:hypothetical protein
MTASPLDRDLVDAFGTGAGDCGNGTGARTGGNGISVSEVFD